MDLSEFQRKINETRFGFLFYLLPIVLLSVLFYVIAGCFYVFLVPLGALAVPYYMGYKGPKKFAILGVFILIANTFAFGAVSTQRAYDYNNYWAAIPEYEKYVDPQMSEPEYLLHGIVYPKSGEPDTEFNFTVIYNRSNGFPPEYVNLVVVDSFLANGHSARIYEMAVSDPATANYSGGVEFFVTTTLPARKPDGHPEAPNHYFYFVARDSANNTFDTRFYIEDLTAHGFGPMNAELVDVYSYNVIFSFYNMLFIIALFYLGVGMYWWLKQARVRSSQWQERMEEMQKEEYAEFECDRCGSDVPEDADECPKCGAVFDEEDEESEEDEE